MSFLIPSISDAAELVSSFKEWLDKRNTKKAIQAWREVKFPEVCEQLVMYYSERQVPLYSYEVASSTTKRVPIYVRPEWLNLSHENLDMVYEPVYHSYKPSKSQENFLELFQELRRASNETILWNGRIFRLRSIDNQKGKLHLEFEEGRFFDSIMCQYLLEHELITAWKTGKQIENWSLELRDKVAGNSRAIEEFCQQNVARIGISNLLLLRSEKNSYFPVVQKRGTLSLAKGFDTVSSGVLDITTTPKADFEIRHKVIKEVYEELFDNIDVALESRQVDPYFFYGNDGISDLIKLLDNGGAVFQITGFCIDLIRIVPEITTVLIVQDDAYYRRHLGGNGVQFKLNIEYQLTSQFQIPRKIKNLDQYLLKKLPTDPDSSVSLNGFDPMRWTLPGAFCFYQGLRRATNSKLL
ncbi:MAG: hypothetical protein AB1607_00160 [Chloroflexota bacterium]